jgi:hypothetical protein
MVALVGRPVVVERVLSGYFIPLEGQVPLAGESSGSAHVGIKYLSLRTAHALIGTKLPSIILPLK